MSRGFYVEGLIFGILRCVATDIKMPRSKFLAKMVSAKFAYQNTGPVCHILLQPRPQGFSLIKWVGREKALASAGHVYSLNIPEKLIYMQPAGFCADRSRTEQQWKIITSRTMLIFSRVCAVQKLKIHLFAYYSNASKLYVI